jgi:hypothetical protein
MATHMEQAERTKGFSCRSCPKSVLVISTAGRNPPFYSDFSVLQKSLHPDKEREVCLMTFSQKGLTFLKSKVPELLAPKEAAWQPS